MQKEFSKIDDFVFDPTFRQWVLNNHDPNNPPFWSSWVANNPGKAALFNYAKAIVYALSVNHQQLSDAEMKREIQDILRKAGQGLLHHEPMAVSPAHRPAYKPVYKKRYPWMAAAAAIVIAVTGWYFYKQAGRQPATQAESEVLSSGGSSAAFIEQVNNTDTMQLVTLSDGSKVQLAPSSKLKYAQHAAGKKREVELTGEAFFDVKKDPAVPFFVYTQNMVTKVLGTSFTVKAHASEKRASVLVKTGKVSVYKKENFSDKNLVANKLDGVIVMPNQQVVLDLETNQLSKTIVDKPVMLEAGNDNRFTFNATPLKEVFATLQQAYGITIMYDEAIISSCSLSASLGNESFYDKLNLICKTVDATYESIDGTIIISSKGCN
jgi:transmembrane sensor